MMSALSDEDSKEGLSFAFVHAVASSVGVNCGPWPGKDRTSKDVMFEGYFPKASDSEMVSPILLAQLKCSERFELDSTGKFIKFELKIKNYNDLRKNSHAPIILILFIVPPDESDWLSVTNDSTILKRCGYWVSLLGQPEVPNSDSKTIKIPIENIFDGKTLSNLLERISHHKGVE